MEARLSAAKHESIRIGQLEVRYILDGAAARRMGAFELEIAPGAKVPPPHSHSDNDELVYVLEGTLRYSVDGNVRDLGAGDSMFSPRGSVHAFSNPHDRPARALITLTPDIGAQYFRDVAELFNAGGPPNPQKLGQLMAGYGLVLARP